MKRNFKVFALILISALVFSLIIPATAARKSTGRVPEGSSQTLTNQDGKTVSGLLVHTERQDPELSKALRDYDLIKLDARAAALQIRSTGKLLISTSIGDFDMELAPNDLRSTDYVAQVIAADGVAHKLGRTPVNTYKGIIHGSDEAQARLIVTEGSVEGAVITKAERYFIQPARSLSKERNEDEFVFYKGSDVIKEPGSCGVTLADEVAARQEEVEGKSDITAEGNNPVVGLSPLKIARIATEADAEYVSAFGGAAQANAQILSIMNLVDGIYQVEIGVTFQVVFQNAWDNATVPNYPYPPSLTAPSSLLSAFRNYWNSNFTNIQRSVAHMWTGKNMDGETIGIASVGVVCRTPASAYGVSQRFPTNISTPLTAQTVVLTAHEIGHNFSAFHIDEPEDVPPDIQQPCDNTIMESSVGSGSAFCAFSRSQIIGHANAYASCLVESSTPAPMPSCVETPINPGVNTNASISASDCSSPSRGVRYFADRYSFNGTTGQQVAITMNGVSGNLDPYLYLIGPDGYVITQNDDHNGSNNSRIPDDSTPPNFVLPQTGKYIIEATSFSPQQTGDYTISFTTNGCTLGVSPASAHFSAASGTGTINITASGPCDNYEITRYPHIDETLWLSPHEGAGSGARALGFTVTSNNSAAGRRAFLLVGPSGFNSEQGGIRISITQSGTGPDCSITPIASGQTIGGILSTSDCQSPVRGNGFFTDRYVFDAFAGQQIAITLTSSGSDAFLTLLGPNGVVLLTDDDSGGGTNSRLPGGTGNLTLGLPGTYTIEVGTFERNDTGSYTLSLTTATQGTNPLEDRDFFVNQQYRDFLDREADPAGLNYWTGQLAECGTNPSCISSRRVGVSAAFFVEAEFQRTGSFVYRLYKGGLARRPTFQEFNTDRRQVVEGPGLEADKQALALAFVQRTEFVQRYAGQTTAVTFVDALILSIQQASNVNLAGQRDSLLARYDAGGANLNQSRAFALREAIDSTAFVNGEFNSAFVLMQYFGYLRRDPDQAGFNFWLSVVNNPSLANYRSMVCAFLTSREYQERFSTVVPRSDSECANIN